MSLNSVLTMLLGAALVAVGVLASALADRIRGLKLARETRQQALEPRERAPRVPSPAISVVEPTAEVPRTTPVAHAKTPRAARPESRPSASTEGGEEVIAALVAAGYKRPIATEATWGCTAAERATVEGWAACALRRCARGGMS